MYNILYINFKYRQISKRDVLLHYVISAYLGCFDKYIAEEKLSGKLEKWIICLAD